MVETKWNEDTQNPIEDILRMKRKIEEDTGIRPDFTSDPLFFRLIYDFVVRPFFDAHKGIL
jgi:hypothetical protein